MDIINIGAEEIIELIKKAKTRNDSFMGSYGLLTEYDSDTLVKLYYKSFFETYTSPDVEIFQNEIATNIEIDQFLSRNRVQEMVNNFERLKYSKQRDLIRAILLYNGYPVAILLKYYKEYIKLTNLVRNLTYEQIEMVLEKSRYQVDDLCSYGVYPIDLKEDNILIREKDLDIKLIDLDDSVTRYEDVSYVEKFPYIKKRVEESFDGMKWRILNR